MLGLSDTITEQKGRVATSHGNGANLGTTQCATDLQDEEKSGRRLFKIEARSDASSGKNWQQCSYPSVCIPDRLVGFTNDRIKALHMALAIDGMNVHNGNNSKTDCFLRWWAYKPSPPLQHWSIEGACLSASTHVKKIQQT